MWTEKHSKYLLPGRTVCTLKSGKVSRDLGKELNITGVYGREIEGGAGILLDIPLDTFRVN